MNPFTAISRRIQGERPGMGSELSTPDRDGEMFAAVRKDSGRITIEQAAQLADVSFWQGEIDFTAMRAALDGVIIRAGQRTWVDSRFHENWTKAEVAAIPRGSYWFYDSREKPSTQAALWWEQIKGDPGELVHVADLEESYGGAYASASHMRTFVQEFQRLSGLSDDRIAIYTGYYWWLNRIGNDAYFKRFPLWLAWYADMSIVRVPAPWVETDLLFWQYTSSGDGAAYGVSSREIDLNWYCCSMDDYLVRFALAEPPIGGDMTQWYRVNVAKLNIRSGAGLNYADIGDLFMGDEIEATENRGGWLRISKIMRAGSDLVGIPVSESWCSCFFCAVIPPPVKPPPPADVYPASVTLNYADGTQKNYVPE